MFLIKNILSHLNYLENNILPLMFIICKYLEIILNKTLKLANHLSKHSFYGLVTAIFVIIITIIRLSLKSQRRKKVYFVGPRSSGKTTAICKILMNSNNKKIKTIKRTVPTLETSHTILNDLEIVEVKQSEDDDPVTKFSINGTDKFIFFIRNNDDVYPELKGFDVTFVIWPKTINHIRKDIIYLDENPKKLIELIYKI